MAIAEGRKGKVTVNHTSIGQHTVAELGEWSISGISREMIPANVFGTDVMKFRSGMIDPGTITFRGFFDGSDSTGQVALLTALSSGTMISNSTTNTLHQMRLWANDDTSFESYGYWSIEDSSGRIYMTSMDLTHSNAGLGEVTFTAKISSGMIGWSTST